jgi:apolipoprotein D and lipocalin family protein
MQFVWPVKADYRIVYLDESYSTTVIGRNRRDYVWVMAREPAIPEPEFQDIVRFIETSGYDISKLEEVPQRW